MARSKVILDNWKTEEHVRNLYTDFLITHINDTEDDTRRQELYRLLSHATLTADFVMQLLEKIHAISINGKVARCTQRDGGTTNGFSDN